MRDSRAWRAILEVLQAKGVPSHCEPGAYYLVNNYGAGYDLDGHPQPLGPQNQTYPPQTVPTIAEALRRHGVSWKWYTGGRDAADVQSGDAHAASVARCRPAPAVQRHRRSAGGVPGGHDHAGLRAGLAGLNAFDADVARGQLPAVSFLVPKNLDSGHPGYSVIASYEDFVRTSHRRVQAHPKLWAHTAILVTTDEGGGHFDSGFIQVLDFFGDGPRIPLIVVSPYARRGYVDHAYTDHASILKFIEHNWGMPPLSPRSRDNLPDPITAHGSVPAREWPRGGGPVVRCLTFGTRRRHARRRADPGRPAAGRAWRMNLLAWRRAAGGS